MKKTVLTVVASILSTLLIVGIILEIQAQMAQIQFDEELTIDSTILGEERPVYIHLPRNFREDSNQRYPVLYVLDAGSQDIRMAQIAQILAAADVMPAAIIVGLPNTDRNRDLTPPTIFQSEEQEQKGAADVFLQFIEQELIPHIEQRYPTSDRKALVGHSRGGLFSGYAYLQRPGLFDAYFSFSPAYWRDDHQIVAEAQQMLSVEKQNALWYNSLGSEENDKMKAGYQAMQEQVLGVLPDSLVTFQMTAGAFHGDNSYYSAPEALSRWAKREKW
ncbi:MAG: alpha/beta hydrolase-fold protein [Bacteroidota bacterium]